MTNPTLTQPVTQQHLNDMAARLRAIAEDLEACGPEEWQNLGDCLRATCNNIGHDLAEAVCRCQLVQVNTRKRRSLPTDN
ncbi:hypothetical protein [Bowmanella denitrificans]|uniref:hypothetical protein n=1 Tax=Bowmanella denitrificans TaxID=366582 RepID=UPI000C9B7020|nr:hypothetical protein [Bowmanella denitrificans]